MKKFIAILSTVMFFMASPLWAAGSCTQFKEKATGGFVHIFFYCTGDVSDGSIPNTAIATASMNEILLTHYLYTVSAYPTVGGTAPDAADVFILDARGEDLLGSTNGGTTANKGANLIHATLKKTVLPYTFFPPVLNTLSLKVLNQATASANYTIELVFVR